jgi:hypothetical protein
LTLEEHERRTVKTKMNKLIVWNVLLLLLLACLIPSPVTPAVPTADFPSESEIGTLVAETAAAAVIQTSSALPSITPTGTRTRIPSFTPTSTPTFIYLLPTGTPVPSYTPLVPVGYIIVNGTITVDERLTGRPWTCLVTGSTPPRNEPVPAGKNFYVTWTVMNTGTEVWPNTGIDFIYDSGYRTEERPIQDLWHSVSPGHSINLKVLFTAPKKDGVHNSIWILKVGHKVFCSMKIVFSVK